MHLPHPSRGFCCRRCISPLLSWILSSAAVNLKCCEIRVKTEPPKSLLAAAAAYHCVNKHSKQALVKQGLNPLENTEFGDIRLQQQQQQHACRLGNAGRGCQPKTAIREGLNSFPGKGLKGLQRLSGRDMAQTGSKPRRQGPYWRPRITDARAYRRRTILRGKTSHDYLRGNQG